MKNHPKNLILISIDSLRADAIAANPDKRLLARYKLKRKPKTPVLDSLAKGGIFFNDCTTAAPYTTAAHAAILTGQWPWHNGVKSIFRERLKTQTLFSVLKKEGFAVLWQTDYPLLLGRPLNLAQGADKFVERDENESFKWLAGQKGRRLACFFHFSDIHFPYGFSGQDLHSQDNLRKKIKQLAEKHRVSAGVSGKKNRYLVFGKKTGEEQVLMQAYMEVIEKLHRLGRHSEIMDLYMEGVSRFDEGRFKIFWERLKKIGLLKNSLVVVIGDHGEMWSEDRKGHYEGDLFHSLDEEALKVPLILWGLGRAGLVKKPVRAVDVAPTVLEALGVETRARFDGVSLADPKNIPNDLPAFSQFWCSNLFLAVEDFLKHKKIRPAVSYLASLSLKTNGQKIVRHFNPAGKTLETEYFDCRRGEKKVNLSRPLKRKMNHCLTDAVTASLGRQNQLKKEERIKLIGEQLRSLGYNVADEK